ncbi:MAG TPA: HAD-IA family hydrolase [Burkholderiaceae bacterium]|nr:HAD-IA family hydrolase [Burkholderiaceae bacterium]
MSMSVQRPSRFDLIAFDWDGTLFDSTALIVRCIQAAVADVGETPPSVEAASFVIGMGLQQALAHAAPNVPPSKWAQMSERYRHHYFRFQHEVVLFEGVTSMLADLKARHHWLAVATGKSRRGLDEALKVVSMCDLFDASRTAEETAGKPHPMMLEQLMAEFGVEPDRTLMVGDTTHDLQMAVNAGCPAVGVSYGAHDPQSFDGLAPLFVAHSVPQLHRWLLENA